MEPVVQAWLARQCGVIPFALRAVALLCRPEGELVACWPAEAQAPDLAELAARAASDAAPHFREIRASPDGPAKHLQAAVPFEAVGPGGGALAVEVECSEYADIENFVGLLRCAAAGLSLQPSEGLDVVPIAELALRQSRFGEAATAVATALATQLGCERVSVGFSRRGQTRVEALSHSAQFRNEASLVVDIAAAMDEAVDQDATIAWPFNSSLRITRAHERLAENAEASAVCSVPLARGGSIVGALTFEWPAGLPPVGIDDCERAGALLGPILDLKRQADARILERAREGLRGQLAKLSGPGHFALKGAVALASVALLALALAPGTYRVSARAALEGRVQRAVVAGFEGYISEANARAGDVVRRGQILGRLNERDLQLEKRQLTGRVEQLRREYREAFAALDRTQVSIISAKKAQAEAQLALLDEQLARTLLVAPFAGVVVEGDLTQSLEESRLHVSSGYSVFYSQSPVAHSP